MQLGIIKLDTKRLDEIAKNLDMNTEQAVMAIAFRVETFAKQLSPKKTTALENSIYVVTSEYDGFGKAQAAARNKRPDMNVVFLPPPPKNTAYVGPCVDYGIYQELGTHKMAAHPYLEPGAEMAAKEVGAEFTRTLFK